MRIYAIDIETADNRSASFEYYRKDFRIFSLSLAWRNGLGQIEQWFSTDAQRIAGKLLSLSKEQAPLVAHNAGFEIGVISKLYPRIPLVWLNDTMRMAQLYDAGGQEFDNDPILTPDQMIAFELGELDEKGLQKVWGKSRGLSLEACGRRFLPESEHGHKTEAHEYLKEHHGIKKNPGQHLHLLPLDILERYNNADTRVTLLLYEELTRLLNGFDASRDWQLYRMRIELLTKAYVTGIKVNRPALLETIVAIEAEIIHIERTFRERFEAELIEMQEYRLGLLINKWAADETLKSDRARAKRFTAVEMGLCDDEWMHFNINSPRQLEILFCQILKIRPTFLTATGQPSFKASHLGQWGEGGEILKKRKKRMIVLNQCISTYMGSAYDGRIHCAIKTSGTRTNRLSSGR